MNTRKTLTLCAMLALTATPLAAQAGGGERAVNACVAAFVDQYLSDRSVVVKKMNPPSSPLETMSRKTRYTVDLEARGRVSGEQVAQARCVASRRGEVIELDGSAPAVYITAADFAVMLAR